MTVDFKGNYYSKNVILFGMFSISAMPFLIGIWRRLGAPER